MILYHYTRGIHLRSILREGKLRLATASVVINEQAACWFTRSPQWPPLCGMGEIDEQGRTVRNCDMQTVHRQIGIARILVDESAAPHTWTYHKRNSGIHPRVAKNLAKVSSNTGENPHDWRMSYEPVGKEHWLAVEVWDGHGWVSIDADAPHQWQPSLIENACRIVLPMVGRAAA
jgi:hypothetical protein